MREELFIETRKLKLCCLKIIKTDNAGLWCFSFVFVWRKNNSVNAFYYEISRFQCVSSFNGIFKVSHT